MIDDYNSERAMLEMLVENELWNEICILEEIGYNDNDDIIEKAISEYNKKFNLDNTEIRKVVKEKLSKLKGKNIDDDGR